MDDMTETLAPRSDQINADDFIAGPRTVTITKVTDGKAEQPKDFHLAEYPGRVYRPAVNMRRVIVACLGPDSSTYAGHRLTLFRDPEVMFGRDKTGGIRISHASNIEKPLTIRLPVSRGKREPVTIQPLPASTPSAPVQPDWNALIEAATTKDELAALWHQAKEAGASEGVVAAITTKGTELAQNAEAQA